MKKTKLLLFFFSLFVSKVESLPDHHNVSPVFQEQQLSGFIENKGQILRSDNMPANEVLFKLPGKGMDLYVTDKGLTYVFVQLEDKEPRTISYCRIDMNLAGASIKKENVLTEDSSVQGVRNYYLAHCPQGISRVRAYRKVTIKEVYPGIDWVIYCDKSRGVKYEFIVRPFADPLLIQLSPAWADVSVDSQGNLRMYCPMGMISEKRPESYQSGRKITTRFSGIKNGLIGFELAQYDRADTLLIDPELKWGTYIGGSMDEYYGSVKVDGLGNVFMTGASTSANFPVLNLGGSYFSGVMNGSADVVLLKFDNDGVLLWSTFYGGSSGEMSYSMAIDPGNNVYITGTTGSSDFPLQNLPGAYNQASFGGSYTDIFILKFTNAGVRLWATYFGTNDDETAYSMASDLTGNIYLTGIAAINLITKDPGAGAWFQPAPAGSTDMILVKFDAAGKLAWSTWYGGSASETGFSVATDPSGNVFVTGTTYSSDLPVLNPGGGAYFQPTFSGSSTYSDMFILKFNNAGARIWATYYGGSQNDVCRSLATDATGNLFVTGYTWSNDFPKYGPGGGVYFQAMLGGKSDLFILRFDKNNIRTWATPYGGSDNEQQNPFPDHEIAVDAVGDVYVTGHTNSTNMPTYDPGGGAFYKGSPAGSSYDALILQFSNTGVRKWATYQGSSDWDFGAALAVDPNNCLFVIGEWYGSGSNGLLNPGGGAYYDASFNGSKDRFIMKFCPPGSNITASVTQTNLLCNAQCTGTATATPTGGAAPYSYLWSNTQTTATATGLCAGTYSVTITDSLGASIVKTIIITEPSPLMLSLSPTQTICNNDSATLSVTASGGTPGYMYNWDSGLGNDSVYKVSPVISGFYVVEVTDKNGCKKKDSVEVKVGPPLIAEAGNDTVICAGEKVQLSAGGGSVYSWGPSSGLNSVNIYNPVATPSVTTTYTVTVTSGSCPPAIDSLTITVTPGVTASVLPSSITICNGDTTLLQASGGTVYVWIPAGSLDNPNINSPKAFPSASTNYSVVVSNAGCLPDTAMVSVIVIPDISASVSPDSSVCEGASIVLTASGGAAYRWSPSGTLSDSLSATVTATPVTTTTYSVTVTAGSCTPATNSVTITVNPKPVTTISSGDTIKSGENLALLATGGSVYSWTPATGLDNANTANPLASPTITTTYTVTITDSNGCKATELVTIYVENDCDDADPFLPNAFSPNGDGMNDNLELRTPNLECIVKYHLTIFNRWGEKVYDSTDPKEKWDGTFKSQPCDAAVFDYLLEAELVDGTLVSRKGNVSLVR